MWPQPEHSEAAPVQPELPGIVDRSRWPRRPYCTDDLSAGVRIRGLGKAIGYRYIQANPPHLKTWLVFDIDRSWGALAWRDAHLGEPTWTAISRENSHCHMVWGIAAPVLLHEYGGRDAPVRYLASVEARMQQLLRADPGYAGLLTKNPLHPDWHVQRGPTSLWSLDELDEYVQGVKLLRPRDAIRTGVGRNVECFDLTRKWAYVGVRRYRDWRCLDGWNAWQAEVNEKALTYNGDFPVPLHQREVWHVARSVAKWCWRRDPGAAARFLQRQAERGAKGAPLGGAARSVQYQDLRARVLELRMAGQSLNTIAAALHVERRQVTRWLRQLDAARAR